MAMPPRGLGGPGQKRKAERRENDGPCKSVLFHRLYTTPKRRLFAQSKAFRV